MKIAVITDDGKTISKHFGRAPYYMVLTIEDGKITNRELRNKMGHNQFSGGHGEGHHGGEHGEGQHGPGHGMDAGSHNKHTSMAEAIKDCAALLCGGMGSGAYDSLRRLSIQPLITDMDDIDTAALAFSEGKLVDHPELLH